MHDPSSKLTGSLSRRLFGVFAIVAVLPLVVTVGLAYWSSRGVVASLLEENLGKTARLYASEIDDFLLETMELLTLLAGGLAAEDAVLAEVVSNSHVVQELIILDASGGVAARSLTGEEWALEACQAQREGVAPMAHAHQGHGHEVVVTVPREDGGRLCGRISFTLHQDMISERARSTFGGLAYIVDRSGTVVCHAFEESEPHVHPGQPILGQAAERARLGADWHGVIEVDGAKHLASYAPATHLPWGVWAEVPMDEATRILQPMASRAVLFGIVVVVLLLGLVLVLVRRITAPIEELASASQRIAGGAIGQTVREVGNDEITLLAREFNKMSVALAASVRDLDAKVAERTVELENARNFSDTLLDTVEQRILVVGPSMRIVHANHAAMEAYGEDLIGSPSQELHPLPNDQPCAAAEVFVTQRGSREELTRHGVEGRLEILAIERYPVMGSEGVLAVLEIERDVTELKHYQAHLVHREKMAALGTLAAGLAHEIGNPLASLSSELEMLSFQPSGLSDSLPVLQDQVRRMGALLRELVDLGRAPADQRGLFDAMEVVDDVLRLLKHNARDARVELVRLAPPEPVLLCSSRDRLVQVLLNLGLNAVDALETGGTVQFEVRSAGRGMCFIVRDDGPGLPDDRQRLFEPFFTTKAVGKGTGLGLFVVDRIVTSLGGSVKAWDAEGGGAEFVVEFEDCTCEGEE